MCEQCFSSSTNTGIHVVRDEDFVASPTLEDRFTELENRYEVLETLFDRLMISHRKMLASNDELATATVGLSKATHDLVATIKAGTAKP
jgi:hypothetical protein